MNRSKLSVKAILLASGIGLAAASFVGHQPAAAQSYSDDDSCPAGYVYDSFGYGCTLPGYAYAPYGYGYSPYYGGYRATHHEFGHGFGHGMGGGFAHGMGGGFAHGMGGGFGHGGGGGHR